MFSIDLIESKQERVAINGVEPQMVGMLVSYAYTSEVYISKANVQVKSLISPFFLHHQLTGSKNQSESCLGAAGSSQLARCHGCPRGLLSIHGASDG